MRILKSKEILLHFGLKTEGILSIFTRKIALTLPARARTDLPQSGPTERCTSTLVLKADQ